jgi:hypothetical protein
MGNAVRQVALALLVCAPAAAGESESCSISKGLYDNWLALGKNPSARSARTDALVAGAPSAAPEPEKRQAITREYQAYFQCLSQAAEREDKESLQARCKQSEGDRIGHLVCRTTLYLKGERTGGKEFLDAVPAGKRGAEMVWDLAEISGPSATKLIDELFLLVLDDRETAAAKYFNLAASATGAGAPHVDEQVKLLLRESPAVVVKRWMVLRQYQPMLKKLIADMSASLPPAEMQRLRKGLAVFCAKDNPDCPEIVKVFGRLE